MFTLVNISYHVCLRLSTKMPGKSRQKNKIATQQSGCDFERRRKEANAVFGNQPLAVAGNGVERTLRRRGAGNVTRTHDLLITNQLLYRLSYASTFACPIILADAGAFVNRDFAFCRAGVCEAITICNFELKIVTVPRQASAFAGALRRRPADFSCKTEKRAVKPA